MTASLAAKTARLAKLLGACASRFDIDVLSSCDSTNALLLARAENGAPSGTVIVAEHQTAGRGRRGREWISAAGDSLTFSLLWRFPKGTPIAGLSLAAGLAVAQAAAKIGAAQGDPAAPSTGIRLKWPNDILLNGKKLGGILLELVPGAAHAAVIGIGINLRLPDAMPPDIRNTSAALAMDDAAEQLLAASLIELLAALQQFAQDGFASLRAGWLALHAHQDLPVRLLSDFSAPRDGICRGADADGALLFEGADGVVERVISGEISLRSLT